MRELTAIGTTRLRPYSRNNYLSVYADDSNRVTFVGVNLSTPSVSSQSLKLSQKYVLDTKFAFRPDLISYQFYRTPLLGWYICTANDIVDPFDADTGLYPGRQIIIPSLDSVFEQVV